MGCERSSAPNASPSRPHSKAVIAVIGQAEDDPQWPGIRGGAKRYLAGVPSLRAVFAAPQSASPDDLRATISEVLAQEPQAVCLCVHDPDTARESLDLIASKHAIIVTMGQSMNDARVYGHVSVAMANAAETLGENLSKIAPGRRSYLLLHENKRNDRATNCYQRFLAAAQRQYDLVLLEEQNAATNHGADMTLIENMLDRFRHAATLVTLNPDVWLTVRPAWERRLRESNGEFRFATLSGAPVLWRQLGSPEDPGLAAALVGPIDGEIGFAAAEIATQGLWNATEVLHARTIECELVTPDNLADFARRYSESANGLDVSAFLPPVRHEARTDSRPSQHWENQDAQ